MKELITFSLVRATRILIGGCIAASMYLAFLVIGPAVESKIAPVVRFEEVVQTRDGNIVHLDTSFDKLRACEYLGSQWYGTRPDERFTDLPINYKNTTPTLTRPVGENYDRDWEVILPSNETFHNIFMIINYKCGWPWVTQVKVGPYKLAGSK